MIGNCFLLLIMLGLSSLAIAQEESTDPFAEERTPLVRVDGYLKELGVLGFNNKLKNFQYDNIIHNRINTHWSFTPKLSGELDVRTRIFNGYTVRHNPLYGQFLGADQGVVDLSWTPVDEQSIIIHSQIDRLYMTYDAEKWSLRLGRQRVNWGKAYVWNPNDLFNAFAYLDFDYEERPGTDAIRFQYFKDFASGFEVAYRPNDRWDESILGFLYKGNIKGYDYQLLGAHYYDELAFGAGWAGSIKTVGFKGETTYFHPEEKLFKRSGYILASVGLDYAFANSLYLQMETLYNGNPGLEAAGFGLLNSQISANNLFPSRGSLFLNASYPLHPLVSVSLGGIKGFKQDLSIIIPSVTVSITDNLGFLLTAQLIRANQLDFDLLNLNQNFLYGRLKWSF